ncbi:hypothetical protein HKK52_21190 [Pseudomonas sp. ADAK2]|uniref:hypothetical protein n=1 Tax=unclassified Pseudomonas TaxID=196821 RepID=UPI0014636C3B|nr:MULTISPECIES: hypothetical protein [unclassified Pseudomonas]QJI43362.1 hypothetical protein HKK53_21195 [Pseudomonas sp. ADAK7]QJI49665.1 hypothetical protein HKK52_21190 [Pseudomonas sp. ADAK2]
MKIRRLVGLIPHLIVCALYVPLHNYGVDLYIDLYGGLTSRGIGIGMTSELMVQYFILMNAIVFLIPVFKFKLVFLSFMLVVILFYFMPHYPVRAMAYTLLGGSLTIAAMWVGQVIDRGQKSKKATVPCILMFQYLGCTALLYSLTACTSQQLYRDEIYLQNSCASPLKLKASHFSNWGPVVGDYVAQVGARQIIGSYISYDKDSVVRIDDDYELLINTTDGSKVIYAPALRAILEGTKPSKQGDVNAWTINDTSICPEVPKDEFDV